MRARLLILALVMAAGGCDRLPESFRTAFSGVGPEAALPYRASLRRDGRRDPNFTVTVRSRGASLEQVRESVRYPGTRYCLSTFGSSEITWAATGTPDNWIAVPVRPGALAFRGRCNFR